MKIAKIVLSGCLFVLAACPSNSSPPTIASFSASASVICDAGPVTLSWAQADGAQVTIDNGVGDVSGKTSASVTVSDATTFTLTSTNSFGTATKSVSVDFLGFPHQPAGSKTLSTAIPAISADRTRLAIPATPAGSALVCTGLACAYETAFASSSVPNGGLYMASLADEFYGLTNAESGSTRGIESALEANSVFAAPQTISGFTSGAFLTGIAANPSTDRIAVAGEDNSSLALEFGELVSGSWSGETVYIGNTTIANPTVMKVGYAADDTPFILYVAAPDKLTLIRRAGGLWTNAAQKSVNGNQALYNGGTNLAAVSPDGKTLVVLWGAFVAGVDEVTAYGTVIDLTTNTIGATATVLAATPVTYTNFYTAAAFSADGSVAEYVLGSLDGRAWTGHYAQGSFSVATAFHPDFYIGASPHVFYDACDTARVLYLSSASAATASVDLIDPAE